MPPTADSAIPTLVAGMPSWGRPRRNTARPSRSAMNAGAVHGASPARDRTPAAMTAASEAINAGPMATARPLRRRKNVRIVITAGMERQAMTTARAAAGPAGQPAKEASAAGTAANATTPASSAAACRDSPRESNHRNIAPGGMAGSNGQRRVGPAATAAATKPATATNPQMTAQPIAAERRESAPPPASSFTGRRRKNPASTVTASAAPAEDRCRAEPENQRLQRQRPAAVFFRERPTEPLTQARDLG